MAPRIPLLDDALELGALLQPRWADISAAIPEWHPRAEGDPDPDPDKGDPDPDPDPDPDKGDPDPEKVKADDDWQAKARKHERAAKKARKEKEAAEARLRDREQADQTDQEKALEQARKEARDEAKAEAHKERRADRLEVAVTRLATKGVKVDDKLARFADPDDAIVHVERAMNHGEIDEDEIFDDEGKVNTDALTNALGELLERKPHLQASAHSQPAGDADAGKGAGAAKDDDAMSVDDHLKAVQNR